MRTSSLFLAAFSVLSVAAQEPAVPDTVLAQRVHELSQAPTDTLAAVASDRLKQDLFAALQAGDGFTRDFSGVPLSRVDAPDGKFRLFTWNIPLADGSHRFEGLMLVRDRSKTAVVELHDGTAALGTPERSEQGPERWYGALYYTVVPVKKGGKTFYTLLGWKGYSKVETRKVVEVLSFKGNAPRFGAELFDALEAKGKPARVRKSRLIFGFNFQLSMSLKWDAANARIVCDHLSPSRPDLEGQWPFHGPDMSYDAYVWEKNHWAYQRDIDARGTGRDGKPWNRPPSEP
ncbi:MAG: hypothetical protein ABI599_05960 [Flavobacteriales bacterium]